MMEVKRNKKKSSTGMSKLGKLVASLSSKNFELKKAQSNYEAQIIELQQKLNDKVKDFDSLNEHK
jgi:predicted transcriptional regulator